MVREASRLIFEVAQKHDGVKSDIVGPQRSMELHQELALAKSYAARYHACQRMARTDSVRGLEVAISLTRPQAILY
jgi:hypothetical protein